jgi:outer membrane protein TolC
MFALVLLLASPAFSLSLDQALDAAEASSPVGALSEARVAEAHAKLNQVRSWLLPTVSAGGASVWQNEVGLDLCYPMYKALQAAGVPVQPSMCDSFEEPVVTPGQQWQAQIVAQQGLFAPSAWLWRRAAAEGEDLAEREGGVDHYQLAAAVLEAWHASARHQALLHDARAAEELAERIEKLAENLVTGGVASKDQLLQARGAVATARATVARATAASEAANAALALVTGQSEPADSFAVPTGAPSLAEALAALDRPDLRMATQRIEAAQAVVKAERAMALPIVGLTGKYYGLEPAPMVAESWNWQVQLGVQVPLFAGGKVLAKTAEARAQVEKATAGERILRDQARLEVIRVHGELSAALASLREREEALRLTEEAVAAAEARLKEGSGSLLTLQQAQGGTAEAQVRLTLARADAAYAADKLRQVTRGL